MITVGVGASTGVTAHEVLAAVDAVLPPGEADVRLATLDARAGEPGLRQAAARRGWPLVAHPAAALARVPVPTPSDRVAAAVGTGSVAEAAALLHGGSLVVPKTVHGRVTVAVARGGHRSPPRHALRPDSPGGAVRTTPLPRPSTPLHPVGLQLHGRRVVVVGGGAGSYRATVGLLDAGAVVTVVSAVVVPALEALADSGSLSWIRRPYAPGDLDAAWYAVAATEDPAVDELVAAHAERDRIFCTRADDPDASSAYPALPDADELLPQDGPRGRVVLVGGGPGDPGLITVRGRQALSQADVVVVDHLGPRSLLAGLRPDVEIVDASKLPRGRAMPQEEINSLLVHHARAGRLVVRLKGGDPFVFGRGMEELLACAAADVPVEVVPGVTSAVGVPGTAGIPVTHRGLTHEFVVVSGHLPPGHPQSLVDWSAIGRLRGTVVVLMGVETASAIAAALIRHGRPADTPVAVVVEGTTGSERTVRTTLADVGTTIIEESVRPPAVWVVGDVVRLAGQAGAPTTAGAVNR